MLNEIYMRDILTIAVQAGQEILTVYASDDFQVEQKDDKSPLTLADKKSHAAIVRGLDALGLGIPVLSEEGKSIPFSERRSWEYLWVVDPLDGTKEFIKRNGEFTVNIALVHQGRPVLGVVYAPVLDVIYYAKSGLGAFKMGHAHEAVVSAGMDAGMDTVTDAMKTAASNAMDISSMEAPLKLPLEKKSDTVTIVASRSHMSRETAEYLDKVKAKYGDIEIKSAGSSLKLCLVAEGRAEVYPRFAPTMEWDTCAGQAIVEQSGGKVYRIDAGEREPDEADVNEPDVEQPGAYESNPDDSGAHEPLAYNKEDLLNPWFIAKRAGFEG